MEDSSAGSNFEDVGVDIDEILNKVRETIILPSLGRAAPEEGPANDEKDKKGLFLLSEGQRAQLLKEICDLIRHIAASPSPVSSALLVSILTPLDLLQRNIIGYEQSHVELIISTCLDAASTLINHSKTEETFVKSMTQVSLDIQMSGTNAPATVNSSARALLKACLAHKAVTSKDRRLIACELAEIGDWETWSAILSGDDGLAASGSMEALKKALLNIQNPDQQLQALVALRQLVQTAKSQLVGQIMNQAGAEVLHFFKMYGTLGAGVTLSRAGKVRRTTACADAMKIVLLAFQQLVSDSAEEQDFVNFCTVVFDYFLIVIRFNGLPNHPLPQTESDPALGRMTAQAVVHVARTAPAPFKATLISMSEVDRAVLEFAVRAEMTGYANASTQVSAKKKLSLNAFKK